MKIVIVAGGANSRFFPLNTRTHKAFLELNGKSLLVRTLESAQAHGFTDVVVVATPRDIDSGGLKETLGSEDLNMNIEVVEQPEAKGQGNALLCAKKSIKGPFVLAAPYYLEIGEIAQQLIEKKKESGAECVFLGKKTDTPELYGILAMNDDKHVTKVIEKPPAEEAPSDIAIKSCYLLDAEFLEELEETKEHEFSLESALTSYAQKKKIAWTTVPQELMSLKYPWHLFDFQKFLFANSRSIIHPNATIAPSVMIDETHGPVIIEEGATIGHAAKIGGPAYIGENALVGDFSFVRGSSLEKNVKVGANTEVVRSIIMGGSSIHYGYLADSILGHGVKIGAGLITANKRLDRANIIAHVKDKKVDMKTNGFGIVIGEKAQLGIRVSTMPGVFIGTKNIIPPGEIVRKNLPHA